MRALRRNRTQYGFTLVELAISFLIIAILLGGSLTMIAGQADQQKVTDTQKSLAEAKEALIGFAASVTPAHLPCPDRTAGGGANANDGVEDRAGANCAVAEGNLPWVTLGIAGTDAWGHRFRYRVSTASATTNFTDGVTGIRLSSTANLTVNDNEIATPLANGVPAVILSHGRNGWGARTAAGGAIPAPPGTNVDELANTDNNTTFTAGNTHDLGAAGGEFDDIVTWLSDRILFSRILQAKGTLPP